jgi:hypothetical protein
VLAGPAAPGHGLYPYCAELFPARLRPNGASGPPGLVRSWENV